MKRKITTLIIMLAALFAVSVPATASASDWSYTGYTQLSNDYWLALPNATNHGCSDPYPYALCAATFQWSNPAPGKITTIRLVNQNGDEVCRIQISANDSNRYTVCYVGQSGSYRFQGRVPNGQGGGMANAHWYSVRLYS